MNYRKITYLPDFMPKQTVDLSTDVVPGLSYTPADMLHMTESNVAVSSFGLDYTEGTIDTYANHADVPLERIHGVDVVDVWETQQNARYKFMQARKKQIELDSEN